MSLLHQPKGSCFALWWISTALRVLFSLCHLLKVLQSVDTVEPLYSSV